ncbi:transmembrane protein 131-like isoform X1 [Prionailurus iriomotensis]
MAGLRRPQPGCYCRTAAAVNLLLGVFQVLLPCCRPGGAQGQAIEPLQNVVELWQAEEGELLLPTQGDSEEDMEEHSEEQSFSDKLFSGKGLHFQPSVLDFGIQFLGHPAAKILYAYNPSRDSEVVVNSVFTAARHFHVPPVHCRVIPAMGKTSFRIIFLPTEEGSIESSLFINTSSYGVLPYRVSGIGTRRISTEGSAKQLPNAYFLLPQVQSIQLSQTQAETTNTSLLQVQLECSLRNKVCQQLKSCYMESDDVLRLQMSIIVTMENSSKEFEENTQDLLDHLSIIYVATDKSETSVPSELAAIVMVLQQESCPVFGFLVFGDSQNGQIDINVEKTLSHGEHFYDSAVNMYILHSGNSLIWIQFEPVLVPTSATNFTKIASFTCKATSCASGIKEDVKKIKNTPTLKACLSSPVIQGYFRMDSSATQFHIETHENTSGVWSMWYLNHFDHSVVLNDVFVSKETKHILKILNFTGPLFLPPGCWNIFTLKLAIKDIAINLFTNVFLTTNTGAVFAIPLQIYSAPTKEGSLGFEVIAHCGMHYFMGKSKTENPNWEGSLSLDRSTWDVDLELANKLYERWKKFKNGDGCKRTALGMTRFGRLKKSKESESFVSYLPRLITEPGLVLNFSATALRSSVVKYFLWFGTDMQMINFTTGEFQLTKACPYQGMPSEESEFGILHLHLQPLEMKRVGVVFTPADYGKVTSLILIRNNLTVIDMIGVEGFGARELLKVGGRLPGSGGSLRFKVPESTLMDCRRLFTPDFTSSWVIRELTLVTAADLEFHFTLNVTLPHHLLPLCADVVPGPSWEESFWRLTVFFVSLSLLGVILIAFQQAQYILMEFMKTRQRQNASSSSQQNNSSMDVISSHSHKSNCKNFLDTYGPSDKGRGKSCLPVNTPQSRIQNAARRSPGTYGHSQKKHKCSVYYSKHRPSPPVASSANTAAEERQTPALGSPLSAPREDVCTDVMGENWINLKYASGINVNLQKNLTLPKNLLNKEENTLKNTVMVNHPSSECHMKEEIQTCMFPKETDIKTSENIGELKERELCSLKTSKKLPENHLSRSAPQYQSDLPEISGKNNGNNQQVPVKNEVDSCETLKKVDTKSSSEKKIHKASKEDICFEKQDIPSVEQEDPYRRKKLQEKKEGNLQNLSWNKNRTCRKNKKRVPSEQSELKLVCNAFERPELSSDINVRNWCIQENPGEICKTDAGIGSSLPAAQEEAVREGYYQKTGKKCVEKSCSDSSSDCGSSSGGVRASRGSWGSWSSSSSSSDGDKKPAVGRQHFLPGGDNVSQNDFPSETPISLNLSHNICNPTRETALPPRNVNNVPQYAEPPCPSLPAGPAGVEEDKGLYPPGDLWPTQPMCVTSSYNCAMENSMPGVMQGPAPVHNSSFIDWSATCEGQFPSVYCPLELNDYNAFPEEENMNYPNGFPCPAEIQTDVMDHNSQSTWSPPPNMPTAWGHASLLNSPPYLTSTRSLSPMSGLFGSIWAPQSDVYESCCPISPTTEHSTHMENQAVMCKEYYPGFNPFRAYMNLDIWTTTADRSASFPLSRDSSYCGNV